MSDLRDLYQEVILDHNKRPRNFRKVDGANCRAEGKNPLCGDHVEITARTEDDRIVDLAFEGSGCAISRASASMMTEALKGRTVAEAKAVFERFHDLVTGKEPAADGPALGKLSALGGVSEFPMRVKCATLSWHTLQAALDGRSDPVTTE